tara:strand:+ start:1551 stop:2141 length:591 start_codon:yes stop_codon:yes gene_type:complete
VKAFYVVLVIVALLNCLILGRLTGPGASSARPGTGMLFAVGTALLLTVNSLLTITMLIVTEQVSGRVPAMWLAGLLSTVTAGLLLLPLSAWLEQGITLPRAHRRCLLAMAGTDVAILTSLLCLAHAGLQPWTMLLWAVFWAICAGCALLVTIVIFADLRLRLRVSECPDAWRDLPLELATAGILALALLSPTGGLS